MVMNMISINYYRVKVLVWAGQLAEFSTMWVMMTYLTDVWKLDITHAARVVNLFVGTATILPIGMAFFVDAFVGDYCCLLVSSLAFSFGMTIITVSTLTINVDTHKFFFYIALTLNALGMSGHRVSLISFLERQNHNQDDDIERKRPWKSISFLKGDIILVLFLYAAAITLSYAPWCVRYGMPAVGMIMATLLFMSGSCSYKHARSQGSPLTTVCRVLVASLYKRSCHIPQDANQLYEYQPRRPHFVPHTQGLRFLDKAAIIVPTQTPDQQEQNRWKVCRVTEVEEVKILIRMIPLWMTFIMSGVVRSIGDTYFLEQANNMNHKIGKLTIPGLFILQAFYQVSKLVFTKLSSKVANKLVQKSSSRCVGPIGVMSAMVFSVVCCITAAKVETERLNVTKSVGLVEKPSEIIPMSMFWLLPQFFFLAAVDGTSEYLCEDLDEVSGYCIACFYKGQVPSSIIRYMRLFTNAICGAGIVSSVILTYVVSSFSKMGGRPSWFQDTLNGSRLDYYYWIVTVMSFINLVFCILVAIWYAYQHLMLMMWDVVVAAKRVLISNKPQLRKLNISESQWSNKEAQDSWRKKGKDSHNIAEISGEMLRGIEALTAISLNQNDDPGSPKNLEKSDQHEDLSVLVNMEDPNVKLLTYKKIQDMSAKNPIQKQANMRCISVANPIPRPIGNFITLRLTPTNYPLWREQALALAESQELVGHLTNEDPAPNKYVKPKPGNSSNADNKNPQLTNAFIAWRKFDRLLQGWIIGTLSEEALGLVTGLDTAQAIWETLKNTYAQESQEREFTLCQQLTYLRKEDHTTITEHIQTFKGLCDNLEAIGKLVPDQEKAFYLLNSLGPQYETCTTTMLKPPRPSYSELVSQLQNYDQRQNWFSNHTDVQTSTLMHQVAFYGQQQQRSQSNNSGHRGLAQKFRSTRRGFQAQQSKDSSQAYNSSPTSAQCRPPP